MFNISKLPIVIDNMALTDDNIVQMGKYLITFEEYMLSLEKQNGGFEVTFLKSNQGWVTWCIWQPAMRDNFERLGGLIDISWPYMSISMYNELNSVCLACEGIVCGERVDAYNAMLQFVLHHSNKWKREDIDVVVADGILDQENVTSNLGLPNANYMSDVCSIYWTQYYPQKIGIDCYKLIGDHIKEIIYSETKDGFDKGHEKAFLDMLQSRDQRHAKHESSLRELADQKHSYASYILCKINGTRGKHGSSISETNHASILVHLNDGSKLGNGYYEKPHTLVKNYLWGKRNTL